MHAEVRGERMGINALYHAGPRDQTWVVGLGGDTCLASLSHLTCSGKTRATKADNLKRSLVNGREYGQEESEQSLLELQATERRQD